MSKTASADAALRQQQLVRAISLQNQGADAEAGAALRALLQANPNDPLAIYSLAALLLKTRALDEAFALVERGVALVPQYAPMWFAHAMALQSLGRKEAALASYDRAIALKPDHVESLLNSGALLREMQRHLPSLERFNRVLEVDPNHESALGNLGILLTEFKQSAKAIAMFERLLGLNPDYPYGLGLLCYERLHACDWTDFDALSRRIVAGVQGGHKVCKPLALMAVSDSAEDHLRAARTFSAQWFPKSDRPLWNGERYAHRRLRIAYVSPDLREHPVGHLMAGVFERHDKRRFETFAISLGIDDGSRLRERMKAAFDHFIDVRGQGARQIAETMRAHEIDIAIDLAGYTSDSRIDIFAQRPAPLQATFLGYPGTLGTEYIDCILADRHVIPPEHAAHYAERVVYLPDSYLPTDAGIRVAERTPTRAECGLPETGAVLCSFSHDYKIHPRLFAVWLRLLQRLPGSVLWLASRNALAQANLQREAQARGVDPARLVFAERVPRVEDHLARYRLADVFLDTSPYNAHTTAADALMVGLPVVTVMGGAFPARVAGSLLHAIGLPELIAASFADYEELVVALVSDRARLADVKARLAANRHTHPLFDTDRFCRNFEGVLERLAGRDGAMVSTSSATELLDEPAAPNAAPAMASGSVSPPEPDALRADLDAGAALVAAGNPPQAELLLRRYLRAGGTDPSAQRLLGAVAAAYGLPADFRLVEPAAPRPDKYLLVKAWGYGFWSDMHHVLGQLLVAELTGRTPIVRWGANSLFGDGSGADAFAHFFAPLSGADADPAVLDRFDASDSIYPPKWRGGKLAQNDLDKWSGADARRAAPYFFARDEDLVVSDFFATVSSIVPWIGAGSRWFGLADAEIYRDLFARHLKPQPAMVRRVDAFFAANMAGRNWVAVHARGSDKIHESAALHETNARYFAFVDRIVELNPSIGVFLLTDSVDLHQKFQQRYRERLVATPALRSDSTTGVHLQGHEGRTVGEEVLVDALLAARCDYFVGNRESNVSVAIESMKAWRPGLIVMLGERDIRADNLFLHRTETAAAAAVVAPAPRIATPPMTAVAIAPKAAASTASAPDPCRLCGAPTVARFVAPVMSTHDVRYLECSACRSLQTEPPHWLAEAYAGPAERFDTGKASRTLVNFLAMPPLLAALGVRPDDRAVDFGGGTGLFARLMRDAGHNFHTCDKFGSSEFMGGYAWRDLEHCCKLVTLFEVAEHFAEPAAEWQRIFASDPDWIVGSTSLYTGQGADWSYLSGASGQHVFFYSSQGLAHLAAKAGRHAYHLGMYFLITRHPLDAATSAAILRWRDGLASACQTSFDAWARGPYRHASADNAEVTAHALLRQSGRRVAIDGTFFRFASGIARVWKSLLTEWAASGLAESLVVIDRGRTAPRLAGIAYVDAPLYDYAKVEDDRALLQAICDRERVGLFISTYYTTPLTTPSALLVLDMIPEVMGFDLRDAQWVGKRQAIAYARAFLSISESTDRDLVRHHPGTAAALRQVAHCGCDFRAAPAARIADFKARHGITKPYFLISGTRSDYKNALLFFRAFERFGARRGEFAIVCTNANQPLEPAAAAFVGTASVHMVALSDDDLQCAYSGAIALAYPSRYEGFGLPVAEAMACGCPVVTCRNSSLPEVGGDAVIYVDPDDADAMFQALGDVQAEPVRAGLVARGLAQATRFSWSKMARQVGTQLALWAVDPPLRPAAVPATVSVSLPAPLAPSTAASAAAPTLRSAALPAPDRAPALV